MTMSTATNLQGARTVISRSITSADAATTVAAIDIPAGTLVPAYGVSVWVKTAMSGGTPSYTVGDGDDTDGWLTSADITEATAGLYNSVAAAYSVSGKYYSAADTIDIVITTGLTAGECFVVATLIDVSDIV